MSRKTVIMGIINLTPDSFYDGGSIQGNTQALKRTQQCIADGAEVIDVGAESSRPDAEPISIEAEQARLLPVLDELQALDIKISVDTYRADTARRALKRGVWMINDITALQGDASMVDVIAEAGCPCILMHMQGTPQTMQRNPHYDDLVDDICAFFEERMAFATNHGVQESALWLDPGFGFGKTVEHNLEMIRRLGEFKRFGRPIVIGASNKSTIGTVLEMPLDQRLEGTAATIAIAIYNGADCVRVHDVKTMARVAKMSDAILTGTWT